MKSPIPICMIIIRRVCVRFENNFDASASFVLPMSSRSDPGGPLRTYIAMDAAIGDELSSLVGPCLFVAFFDVFFAYCIEMPLRGRLLDGACERVIVTSSRRLKDRSFAEMLATCILSSPN